MRKIFNELVVLIVVIATIFGQTLCVKAQTIYYRDGFGYSFYEGRERAIIMDYYGTATGEIVIPLKIHDAYVIGIGDSAFNSCSSITGVKLHENIKIVGSAAFANCLSLEKIVLPDKITVINDTTFYRCSSLTDVTWGNITEIGAYAFWQCSSLKSLIIPKSVNYIGAAAFDDCKELNTVYYTGTEQEWNEIYIDRNNTSLTKANIIFNYHTGDLNDNISWETGGNTLTVSGSGEMPNYSSSNPAPWQEYANVITNVVIEEGITSVGKQSFRGLKNLETVKLPSTLDTIESYAFIGCNSLNSVDMYAATKNIKIGAFNGCYMLESINVTGDIEDRKNLKVASLNTEFLNGGLVYSSDEGVIYSGISGRCEWLYDETNKTLTLKENSAYGTRNMVNYFSYMVLPWRSYINDIETAVFDGVRTVGNKSLYGAESLKNVVIGDTVTRIGTNAFYGSSLEEITLTDSIETIGTYAFKNVNNLKTVNYNGTKEEFGNIRFGYSNKLFINADINYIQ